MRILALFALVLSVPPLAAAQSLDKYRPQGSAQKKVTPRGELQVRPEMLEQMQEKPSEAPSVVPRQPPRADALKRRPAATTTVPSLGPAAPLERNLRNTEDLMKIKLPDLVTTVQPPSGSSTYYNFVIRNEGDTTAAPMVFEISLGPPCHPVGDVMTRRRVLKRYGIKALKVTTSSSMAHKVGHDLGDWAGTGCKLIGTADADEAVLEKNESNNAVGTGTAYQTMPDLKITWDYSGDGPWSTRFGVLNVGDANAGASTLYMSCTNSGKSVVAGNEFWPCNPSGNVGQKTWNWSIPSLAPGQRHMVNFPLSATNPPKTNWWAKADHDDVVDERRENNNGAKDP